MADLSTQQTVQDLEKQLRDLQAQLQQAAQYQHVVDSSPDGYILFDCDLRPTFINASGARLYQQIHDTGEQADAPHPQDAPHPAEPSGINQVSILEETLLRNVFETGQPVMVEYKPLDTARGSYIEARYIPHEVTGGKVHSVTAILRDYTGRKRVSEAQQVSETLIRAALVHAGIRVYTQDTDLCYNWIYDQQVGILGQAYPGKTDADFYTEADAMRLTELKRQVLETGQSARKEVDLTLHGEARSFELMIEPLKNSGDTVTGLLCSSLDITERRKTAHELERLANENNAQKGLLARHNELLQAVFDVDPSGLAVLVGETLEHRYVNPAYRAMLPYPDEEPLGRGYTDVWPQSENFRGSWIIHRVMQAGNPVHLDYYPQQFADGSTRYYGINLRRLTWEGQPAVLVVLWDVTDRETALQRAEQAVDEARLRAAEAQEEREILEALLEYAPEGIAISNADGRINYISRYGKKMAAVPLENRQSIAIEDQQVVWGIYHLDGITPAEVEQLPLTRATQMGEVIINEEWMLQHPDQEPIYISCNAGPIRNQRGAIAGGLITWQDITERKRTEAALARYAGRMAASNRELEQFASVASHDLQEPLRKIQAFGGMLVKRMGEDTPPDDSADLINRMVDASQRMQRMINDLLTFSRVSTQARPPEPVDLQALAGEVLSDLEVRVRATGGQVQVGPLPALYADPLQMRQLLQNLVGNALKYHRPEVSPIVKLYGRVVPTRQQKNKEDVQIFVEDNGIGFDISMLPRILQPFERLHGRGEFEGTGMGLAICQKIVERHHGSITALSEPGKGSTFIVTLPRNP